MAKFLPPKEFSFSPGDWASWKERFERYCRATKLDGEEDKVKIDILIYNMGEKADRIFKTFVYDTDKGESCEKYDIVLSKFEQYFVPKRNVIYERSIFHARTQSDTETVEQYYSDLHVLVGKCAYPEAVHEEMLRDRFVLGLRDKDVQCKLYMEEKLSISKAVDMARQTELIKQQMSAGASSVVHEVRKQSKGNHQSQSSSKPSHSKHGNKKPEQDRKRDGSCDRCGYQRHKGNEKCPAYNKTCGRCHRKGHFRVKCKAKLVHEISDDTQGQPELNDIPQGQDYFFGAIDCPDDQSAWYVTLHVQNSAVKFKIDTGADVTTIGRNVYQSMEHPPPLEPADKPLSSVGGLLTCDGIFDAYSEYKGTMYRYRIAVVPGDTCLLGRCVSEQMGLVQRLDSVNSPKPGARPPMQTDEVNISLRDDHKPYCASTPSKIAFPLLEPCKKELKRMVDNDIIESVTEPTDWCARMVPVPKRSGDVRICVDLKLLNRAVRREHFPLPTLEDIAPELAGSTLFSSLDAASGFWQVPLNKASRKLTTFITPFGRFMFKRLPFGISSASEIFQRKMADLFGDEEGIEVIIDDILIHGKDRAEHDARLNRAIHILNDAGVILNMSKCKFRVPSLIYFGHVVSKDGVEPHPDRVAAIMELPPPTNVTELKSVNGMFNYVAKFVPHLSTVMKPMTDLLKADAAWVWGPDQENAFRRAKELLCAAPALAYYDPKLPTTVSADASSYGLGAVLLQQHSDGMRPVAFCSRTLTPSESRYAQIEKECLAAVWACEKLHRYLIGLPLFTLETDHKPLVPLLMNKNLSEAPVRCQRLLMRMMRFNPEVIYVPGKSLVIADALSRKPLTSQAADEELADLVEIHVDAVAACWPASQSKLQDIREASEADTLLRQVAECVTEGWPSSAKQVPLKLLPYYRERGELSAVDGIVAKGSCIVIPESLRPEILERLHESHQGLTRTRERARDAVWWPGLSHDLQVMSESCTICKTRQRAQVHEPLKPSDPPPRPWAHVAVDLADYRGLDYLVLVDTFSRWIEIKGLKATTTAAVNKKLMEIFITHGYPDEIHSDNGPQFTSDQFRRFAARCGSIHVTSSPYFHQSNGAAERAVQTAKSILNLENPEQGLLDYRSTPCTVTGVSPAECLMGRRLRTRVPVLESQLVPKSVAPEAVRARDRSAKEVYKHHYDRRHGARTHPSLKSGQPVLMRVDEEKGGWKKAGSVVESNMNRSYLVQTPDGSIYRRNRKHLLPLPQPSQKAVTTYLYPPSGTAPSPGAPGPSPMIAGELPPERESVTDAQISPPNPPDTPKPSLDLDQPRPRRETRFPIKFKDYHVGKRK